jgi:multidrug resistance efflux pump
VTPGVHTFSVAATDAALNADLTPATVTFTAYDCPTLQAAVAKAQKQADKAKKAVKKAKKSGNASKIKKAKKKLKKAKKALKKAKAAAAPCGSTPKTASGADTSRK